jgi:hypothetical protein
MTERPTLESYIVRIYRVDTEDPRKIAGMVEPTDGSGKREPFTDLEELGAILGGRGKGTRKGRKKRPRSGGLD